MMVTQQEFDVFISYRRAGGADFAQLLKVQLMSQGYTAFLDTDNLGATYLLTHLPTSPYSISSILCLLCALTLVPPHCVCVQGKGTSPTSSFPP